MSNSRNIFWGKVFFLFFMWPASLLPQEVVSFEVDEEPLYTKGDKNIVFVEIETEPDTSLQVRFEISRDSINWDDSHLFTFGNSWPFTMFNGKPLQDGVKYYYRVLLRNIGIYSNIVRSIQDQTQPALIDTLIPEKASSPVAGWLADSTFHVTATLFDSAGVWQAKLYRRERPENGNTDWALVEPPFVFDTTKTERGFMFSRSATHSFAHTVEEDGHYEFRIEGVDGTHTPGSHAPVFELAGNEHVPPPDDPFHLTISIDTTPPDTVQVDCKQEKNTIELWWDTPSDGDGVGPAEYHIYRDGDSLTTVIDPVTHFTDTKIDSTKDATYHYQIFPVDRLGNKQTKGGNAWCDFWGIRRITMEPEPAFTAGTSNIVIWQAHEIFKSFKVFVDLDCDASVDTTIEIPERLLSTTIDNLQHSKIYCYWVEGTDEHDRTALSEPVQSTQDDKPPLSNPVENDLLKPFNCLTTRTFDVPFEVCDIVSKSVDSATLYFRYDSTSMWEGGPTLDLDENLIADCVESKLESSFIFTSEIDSYLELYVGAKDGAWAEDQRNGRAGNPDIPADTTKPHYQICVDTGAPHSRVDSLESVQKSLCFDVPYKADDIPVDENGYESGLRSVSLFYRFEKEPDLLFRTHHFSGETAEVDSFFQFEARKSDGKYYFYTVATDTCGNEQIVNPDTVMTMTLVQATPQIESIYPPEDSFNRAADVDTIKITFDRPVRLKDTTAITIINKYSHNDTVRCTFPPEAGFANTIFCIPEIDPTGFYEICIKKSKIETSEEDCIPLPPGICESTQFYTYMEEGQGGQVATEEITISVPSGQPSEHVVIVFEPSEFLCTPTGFARASDECFTITAFLDRLGGTTLQEIRGRLCLHYDIPLPSGMNPETIRVFEQIGDRCRPASDSRILPVDLSAQFACADFDNLDSIVGTFCLFGQSPDLLSQQRRLSNYPNPLSTDGTTITYLLEEAGAEVSIRIFDLFGNLVKTFTNVTSNEGLNTCPWNGFNDRGEEAANGGYICVMVINGKEKYRRKIGVMR